MINHVRHLLLGSPLPSADVGHNRLDKVRALAALSPDALASVAYANQEIYLGLLVAGAAGLMQSFTLALVITALLGVLALSYMQTIAAYPSGGGSYTVARENLGELPGLVAAAALMMDYVLNAAVSLTAGVAALASAFPALWPHRIGLSLALLLLITLVNLRGLREAGTAMVVPVYLFLGVYLGMIAWGIGVALVQGPGVFPAVIPPPAEPAVMPGALAPVTLFLLLRTFASGATALTGVEAISNAVPIFKDPVTVNARRTMAAMAVLMGILFLGTIGLTQYLAVVAGPEETILSALVRRLFGSGVVYLLVQLATLLVLIVAANTSYTDFPRVVSLMARDGFVPRQLRALGDRLVFSNGILLLAGLAGLLIVVFGGDTHALIPLFAVGAFLAFTLSQSGMVLHWWRERGPGWRAKLLMNGAGALATGVALLVIGASKFAGGAWLIILLIPLLVLLFRAIRRHYAEVGRQLRLDDDAPPAGCTRHPRIVMPVAGVHRGVIEALNYACSISDDVIAVYVEMEPDSAGAMRARWEAHGLDRVARLVTVPSPYRSLIGPFLDCIDRLDEESPDGWPATVLIPEFVPARWWHFLLHNQSALPLKWALIYRRHRHGKARAVIDVPFYLKE
ncbi:APC family permease [Promineifilum sp.]|uniref:APC family permease n=1 Tax=Promineifilum sp. TaxID=2664178 RepID=UPI0035B15892